MPDETELLGSMPKGLETWKAVRGALRSYCQMLTVGFRRAATADEARAVSKEQQLIVLLWRELEEATTQGQHYKKLVAAMETELDALSRSDASFGISAMMSAPVTAATTSTDARKDDYVKVARQMGEQSAALLKATRATNDSLQALLKRRTQDVTAVEVEGEEPANRAQRRSAAKKKRRGNGGGGEGAGEHADDE